MKRESTEPTLSATSKTCVRFVWMVVVLATSCQTTSAQSLFGPQQIITTLADGAQFVHSEDIDGDGDPDLLSSSFNDSELAWYENQDGKGNFGEQRIISRSASGAFFLVTSDLDGDGDPDVLSTSLNDGKIAWYENTDGKGTFGPQVVITNNTNSPRVVRAGDLDGDGDNDVVFTSLNTDKLAWHENTDGQATFGPEQVITSSADGALVINLSDLDGDSDLDILFSAFNSDRIVWYENTDGAANFGPERVITTNADGPIGIHSADFDGDGDQDAFSTSGVDDDLSWYENLDGLGTFSSKRIINSNIGGAIYLEAADLDNDGDLDILYTANQADHISWHENLDGDGDFGPPQTISTQTNGAFSVIPVDIDGDGDQDVVSGSFDDDKVAWYRNNIIADVAIDDPQHLPATYELSEAYPNPFNPATSFTLTLASPLSMTVFVADLLGRRVAQLHDGPLPAGEKQFRFEAGDLPSGLYVIRAEGRLFGASRPVVLLK